MKKKFKHLEKFMLHCPLCNMPNGEHDFDKHY